MLLPNSTASHLRQRRLFGGCRRASSVAPSEHRRRELFHAGWARRAAVEPLEQRRLLAADPVLFDLNVGSSPSNPELLTASGDLAFFTADDGVHGRELWRSDGTEAGTFLVSDLTSGSDSTSIASLTAWGDSVLFAASTGEAGGSDLWISAGDGAVRLAPLSRAAVEFSTTEEIAYFINSDSEHGEEVWRTDGTPDGTHLLYDVAPGTSSSSPSVPVVGAEDVVYFAANDVEHGREVWCVNPGATAATLVADVNPGPSGSDPDLSFGRLDGATLFAATDVEHGREVWRTDGTEDGTFLAVDAWPGANGSNPSEPAVWDGYLYFAADHPAYGREVWRTNGELGGGELFVDLNPTASSDPQILTLRNGLAIKARSGVVPWSLVYATDGTLEGTKVIFGEDGAEGIPESRLREVEGGLATFTYSIDGDSRLGVLDGAKIAARLYGWHFETPQIVDIVGSDIYYTALSPGPSNELSHVNIDSGVRNYLLGLQSPEATSLGAVSGHLFFTYADDLGGEPTISDGTPEGTSTIADLWPGRESSHPGPVVDLGGAGLFAADDGMHGRELWVYRAEDVEVNSPPVAVDDVFEISEDGPAVAIDVLANDSDPDGDAFAIIDLDAASALGVASIAPDGLSLIYDPNGQFEGLYAGETAIDVLSYTIDDGRGGRATAQVTITIQGVQDEPALQLEMFDLRAGIGASDPQSLTAGESQIFFTADDGVHGRELWRSDGTEAGTFLVKDLTPGGGSSSITSMTAWGDSLFFVAPTGEASGYELWISDGTEAGTTPLGAAFNPATQFSLTDEFAYFVGVDDQHGDELWRTDGTPGGTGLVADVNPGPAGSDPSINLVEWRGASYFAATDAEHGREVWRTDGTEAGTTLADDVLLGTESSAPSSFVVWRDDLYFVAFEPSIPGRTLWKIDEPGAATEMAPFTIFPGGQIGQLFPLRNSLAFSASAISCLWGVYVYDGISEEFDVAACGGGGLDPSNAWYLGDGTMAYTTGDFWSAQLNFFDGAEVFAKLGFSRSIISSALVGNDYFASYRVGSDGSDLVKLDLETGATTGLLGAVQNYDGYFWAMNLSPVGDYVYFTPASYGNEPWVTDGTAEGTVQIADIQPGFLGSQPSRFVGFDEKAFFTADDGTHGRELWVYRPERVAETNRDPNAAADQIDASEDGPAVVIDVLANDSDPDGDELTITSVSDATGLVTIAPDGKSLMYDPNGQFEDLRLLQTATDVFTYTVDDGRGGTATAQVTATIQGNVDWNFDLAQYYYGDINGDDVTDLVDFNILKVNFGSKSADRSTGDLTGDGITGLDDFTILKQSFGHDQRIPPLTVLEVSPAANANDASAAATITATFSAADPIDSETVQTDSLVVQGSLTGKHAFQAKVVDASIELTVAEPFLPGETVTVLVSDAIGTVRDTYLEQPYQWSFRVAATGPGMYAPAPELTASEAVQHPAVDLGDLDGDGDLDLFDSREGKPNQVYLNDGTGIFTLWQTFGAADRTRGVELGDLDGDGDLDAFVAHVQDPPNDSFIAARANTVWLNDGTGRFTQGDSVGGYFTQEVDLGDLDGDGDLDVFAVNRGLNRVWLNDGSAHFTESQAFGPQNSRAVELGDLDGDGDLDAFVVNTFNLANIVYLNDGTGRFTETGQFLGVDSSDDVALGDLDGDGDLDAFVGNAEGAPDRIYFNDGYGFFTESTQSLPSGGWSEGVALGDVDGDGDLDAMSAVFSFDGAADNRLWLNDGLGQFTDSNQLVGSGRAAVELALGDVDGDGSLDAAFGNINHPITIWLNREVDQTPPTVDIVDVTPDPRTAAVDEIMIAFSEPVTGFDLGDLILDEQGDGLGNRLTGSEMLSTTDGKTYTLAGLAPITANNATYNLNLNAESSGIVDLAGNPLQQNGHEQWRKISNEGLVQIATLAASDVAEQDQFGASVSISEDGRTIVVGSPYRDGTSNNEGAAYVYSWNGTEYEESLFVPSAPIDGLRFGFAVEISSDGNVVVVATHHGWTEALYIYRRNGSAWSETRYASDHVQDGMGNSISVSADGHVVAVGASTDYSTGIAASGSVYVYRWDGADYAKTVITASDAGIWDIFGYPVSISADGQVIAVRSNRDDGSFYFYRWDGTTYSETKLASRGSFDQTQIVGPSLSGDGETVALVRGGSVYLYEWDGSTYVESLWVGTGVRPVLSADGQTIAVTRGDTIFVLRSEGDSFVEIGAFVGELASLSSDGRTVVIGSEYSHLDGHTNRGVVDVYVLGDA